MKPKPIGIIGGAGPIAGISLLKDIISFARVQYGCWKDEDFPEILFISFPFSDMLSEEAKASQIRRELRSCLQKLRRAGAAALGIACNTLHAFLEPQELKSTDLLRLPQLARAEIPAFATPLVLNTSTSRRLSLYSKEFPCRYPNQPVQRELDELIIQILKGIDVLAQLQALISAQDEEVILLGCTELSLYTSRLTESSQKIIDPLKILAKKLIKTSMKKEGGDWYNTVFAR